MGRAILVTMSVMLTLMAIGVATAPGAVVSVRSTGPGSVAMDPGGNPLGCADTGWCRYAYPDGATATMVGVPAAPPSVFGAWRGDCSPFGAAPQCTVAANVHRNVIARFGPVALQIPEARGGAFDLNPQPQAWCGKRCALYPYGAVVSISAQPAAGWRPYVWSGVCQSASASRDCRLTLLEPRVGGPTFCQPEGSDCIASQQQPLVRRTPIDVRAEGGSGTVQVVGQKKCINKRSCNLKVTAKSVVVKALGWRPHFRWSGACNHEGRSCQFDTAPGAFGTAMRLTAHFP
jgi:hypothetical protein